MMLVKVIDGDGARRIGGTQRVLKPVFKRKRCRDLPSTFDTFVGAKSGIAVVVGDPGDRGCGSSP